MSAREGKIEYRKQADGISEKPLGGFGGSTPKWIFFGLTFCICFAIWLILSGRFDRFHISLGVISCALVAFFSGDLLLPAPSTRRLPK